MMLLLVVAALPWILSIGIRVCAHRADGQFAPSTAVVLLPLLALVTAFSVLASLAALAAVLVSIGGPIPMVLAVTILGWLGWRTIEVARHLRRTVISLRMAARFGTEARTGGGTVLIESKEPDAFAVPSGRGAVVITTGLAEALSDAELRAVVDHERAHLRFHHAFWIQLSEVAALSNPVLKPLVTHVRHNAERQADECAAAHGRRETLTAIARVALLRAHLDANARSQTLSSTGGDVVRRVRSLTEPAPPQQKWPVVVVAILLVLVLSSISVALFDVAADVMSPEPGEAPVSVFR